MNVSLVDLSKASTMSPERSENLEFLRRPRVKAFQLSFDNYGQSNVPSMYACALRFTMIEPLKRPPNEFRRGAIVS